MNAKKALLVSVAVTALAVTGACSSVNWFAPKPPPAAPQVAWEKTGDGLVVTPTAGPAKKVKLVVMTDSIVHVTATADAASVPAQSLIVQAAPAAAKFDVSADGDFASDRRGEIPRYRR